MYNHALNICHLNVFHLYNKVTDINVMLNTSPNKIHILGLSETRLNDSIDNDLISINNYRIIRRDKQFDKHTGIIVYTHDSIYQHVKIRKDLEYKEIDVLCLEVKRNKSTPLL